MSTTFEVAPGYETALHDAGLTDFDAMLRASGLDALSKHAHRETLPIDIDVEGVASRFYLKRVFKVPPKHAFWPLFRFRRGTSQPYREWHILWELEQAGIPVMRRVAHGERRRYGMPTQAFLLVEAVPMEHTLEDWLVPGFPTPLGLSKLLRRQLLNELGSLVRNLAQAGFDWPDISAKHIYAQPTETRPTETLSTEAEGSQRKWEFALIDVERMTRQEPSLPTDRVGDLRSPKPESLIGQWKKLRKSLSPMRLSPEDFLVFWAGTGNRIGQDGLLGDANVAPLHSGNEAAFCDTMDELDLDKLAPVLSRFGVVEMPRLPDDYEHPRTIPLRKVGRMFVDERMIPWLQQAGLGSFAAVFEHEGGDHLDKPGLASYRDRIRLELSNTEGTKKTLYLKRYERPPLKEQLRRIRECGFKSSSGWREMHFIKVLSMLGIPTMRGVAFGQRMKGVFEKRSFGITEEIVGESLERFVNRAVQDSSVVPTWSDRREIIRQLALIAGGLHGHRLYHRDLYLCHVFLTRNADGGIVLRLIDLARMIAKPRNPSRWAIKDLAALTYSSPSPLVTRADRLRFLYDYCPESKGRKSTVRRLIASVEQRVSRMARHDAHRARRLAPKTVCK